MRVEQRPGRLYIRPETMPEEMLLDELRQSAEEVGGPVPVWWTRDHPDGFVTEPPALVVSPTPVGARRSLTKRTVDAIRTGVATLVGAVR